MINYVTIHIFGNSALFFKIIITNYDWKQQSLGLFEGRAHNRRFAFTLKKSYSTVCSIAQFHMSHKCVLRFANSKQRVHLFAAFYYFPLVPKLKW